MGRAAGVQEEGALVHWSAGGKGLLLGLERVLHGRWRWLNRDAREEGPEPPRVLARWAGARRVGWRRASMEMSCASVSGKLLSLQPEA